MMNNSENQELKKKYDKKQGFFREMEGVARKYKQLEQQAYYCTLTGINPEMIIKIPAVELTKKIIFKQKRQDLYLINGLYQPTGEESFEKFVLQMVQVIPRPNISPPSPYGIIYNNVLADSGAFNDFKKVMQLLPWEFLINLTKIYVLRPNFYSKVSSWISFGTVSNYLTSKTANFQYLNEFSKATGVSQKQFTKLLPPIVIDDLDRSDPNPKPPKSKRWIMMKQGLQKGKQLITFQKSNQSSEKSAEFEVLQEQKKQQKPVVMIKGPEYPSKRTIEQYEVGPTGAPIILEILVNFLGNNPEYLKVEGLFRKSVSIDDKIEILQELNAKNYEFLSGVTDPHLIANAIKGFISYFKEPVIPYELFDLFMQRQGDPTFEQIVIEGIKGLPKDRLMIIFVLFQFLHEKVEIYALDNKMNQQNLCKMFAPCLMYSKVASLKDLIDAAKTIKVMSIIFKRFESIYGNKQNQHLLRHNCQRDYKRSELKKKLGVNNQLKEQLPNKVEKDEQSEKIDNHLIQAVPKFFRKTTLLLQKQMDQSGGQETEEIIQKCKQEIKAKEKEKPITNEKEETEEKVVPTQTSNQEQTHHSLPTTNQQPSSLNDRPSQNLEINKL